MSSTMPSFFDYEIEASELADKVHSLETPTMMMLSDNEATHSYTPPMALAARLRRSSMKRRSSAASSRRNSLSSSHSHNSHRSHRNLCFSNHIAQHLRRTSILESRKARLADRAAHAEQVRSRAALVKAAPRCTNIEEKVLAAQQARQRHLAKVASVCAEEVNRAKRKAEEMKEKKAADERRCRLELEEKHAEAEKRRLEYRKASRRPRTISYPVMDCKEAMGLFHRQQMSAVTAASCIQEAWRVSRRKRAIAGFLDLGLRTSALQALTFVEASKKLAEPVVIERSRDVMVLLALDIGGDNKDSTVKRFLSAYMICSHSDGIFNKYEQREKDLVVKAQNMLTAFEEVLARCSAPRQTRFPTTWHKNLVEAYTIYLTTFAVWQSHDAHVLVETMVEQFVAFDAIWQSVKNDTRGEVASDYGESIRDQQVILFSKIRGLAGPERANILIKRAIRDARRTTPRTGQHIRNRISSQTSGSHIALTENPTVPSLHQSSPSQATEQEATRSPEAGDLRRVFSVIPDNRSLVHELMIDPHYRIELSPTSNVHDTFNKAVCSSMRRAVSQGDHSSWTMAVAENVRERLLKLLKPGNTMHQLLSEVLDSDHIRAQCQRDQFSYENFFSFMADVLPQLCAPVRDNEVQILARSLRNTADGTEAMIQKLFNLLHIIDTLALDYANYMLQQASSVLVQQGIGYEQRMFAKDLDSCLNTLDRTRRWWHHAAIHSLTDTGGVDTCADDASFARIHARGLTDLSTGLGSLAPDDIPETLHLDHNRMLRIRKDLLKYIITGAVLSTAKNLLKRDIRSQWKLEAGRVADILANDSEDSNDSFATRIAAVIGSAHSMPRSSYEQLKNITARFLLEAHAKQVLDPVLKLLFQRLKLHIYSRLVARNSTERARSASTTSEGLGSVGLGEWIGQINAVVEELVKVSEVDQAAHMTWYRIIMSQPEGSDHQENPTPS